LLEKQELLWNIIAHRHSEISTDVKCNFLITSYKTSLTFSKKEHEVHAGLSIYSGGFGVSSGSIYLSVHN